MGRAAEWLENALEGTDVFPRGAKFDESGAEGHVRVSWTIEERGERRRNAPIVVLIDAALVERWENASEHEQERIFNRAVEILDARLATYDPNGRVDVPDAFLIDLDEGSF
ncbi:hypothetical protein [Cupriavidus yeoncheonensis]|uniref:hypothetical protein n=1 Tax=Cupriavidus yeoncheonensis TaxID=1462994 RepID=UPI001BAC0D52|nr:hypothetical protein [Cupriavidus yeoncheonensis]